MDKRAIVILVCFVALLNLNTSAQFIQSIDAKTIDSLEVLLPASEGQGRIDLLNELAQLYAWYDPAKSVVYCNEALEASIKTKYQIGRGRALYTTGLKKYFEGEPSAAIDYFQRAISVLETTTDYYTLGKIYEKYAIALFMDGNDKGKWIEYIPTITELYQAAGNKQAESIHYFVVSGGYFRINQAQNGLEYIHKYWDLIEEAGTHNIYMSISYAVAAACYIRLGDIANTLEFNKKSIDQFDESVFEEMSLKSQVEYIHGSFYIIAQQMDSARKYLYLSLEHSKPIGNAYDMMMAYYHLANLNFSLSDIETSREYCDSALKVASFIDSSGSFYFDDTLKHCIAMSEDILFPLSKSHRRYYAWVIMNSCYKILWDGYLQTNNLMRAVQIQNSWMAVRDSINTYNRNKNILELKVSYETEIKEQELASLSEDNRLKEERLILSYWIVGGLALLVLLIVLLAVVLIRQNKLRNEQHTLLLQQRLLRSQMNPHFLFNTLASIQNFIIKQKPEEASSYLSKFSKLVRQILNSSATEYVSLDNELSSIENYLALQKIRYREMFDYVIQTDDALDPETLSIPPMLAQPFIENAIEHGIKHKGSKGHIVVKLKQNTDSFMLEIEDDGVGRTKAKEIEHLEDTDHKSMATSITRERLANLNKHRKRKTMFTINDLQDDTGSPIGTKVVFEIPIDL